MAESKPQKAWQQYIDNSKKDIKVELENETDFNEKKKAEIEALFLEAQTFEDVLSAVEVIGEIEDGPRLYPVADLEGILKDVKDRKIKPEKVPDVYGLRDAANRSLDALDKREYQLNLKCLAREFKKLIDADDFTDIFVSMKDSNKDNTKTKKDKLQKEYNRLRPICSPDNKADANGQTPPEILEIAKQASAMLEAYKTKADNFIEGKLSAETQTKNEKEFTLDFINDRLGKGEVIKVKVENSGAIETGWRIENVNGPDVVVEKKGTAGASSITRNVKLDDLKKWNAYAYTKKTFTDPKDNDAEKKKIEDNLPIAEELGKKIVSEETEEAKQAFEKRKGFNAKKAELEKSKKKEPITPELIVRHTEIAKKIEELDKCRKEYLEKDYDKTAALAKIRRLISGGLGKKNEVQQNGAENDFETGDLKKRYDDKLRELGELIFKDAKERNLSDEQLAELYASFRIEQKITLADEHDKVKADNIPWVGEQIAGMVAWYQKLPLKYKLGIAAGMVATGAGLGIFGAGASVVGGFSAVVAARRGFGGLVAGVGVRRGLEAKGQKKDQKKISKDEQKNLEELKKIEADEKYDFLSKKMDEIINKDGEDALKRIKNQDIRQNFAAAATGIFLASGWAGELTKMGVHSVAEHWHNFADHFKLFGQHEIPKAHMNVADTQSSPSKPEVGPNAASSAETPTATSASMPEELTIKKGSSIEAALRDHYRADGIDKKLSGAEAHREFRNYMEDKIAEMKKLLAENPGDAKQAARLKEYQEMLDTGRVNIHEGDKLFVDANGKLTEIQVEPAHGGDIKMLHNVVEHHHVSPSHIETSGVETDAPASSPEDAHPGYKVGGPEIHLNDHINDYQRSPGFDTSGEEIYNNEGSGPDLPDQSSLSEVGDNFVDNGEMSMVELRLKEIGIDFLNRLRQPLSAGNHRHALGMLRRELFRNAAEFERYRGENFFNTLREHRNSFSPRGRKIVEVLMKSKEFAPANKDVSVDEVTRNIITKLAA